MLRQEVDEMLVGANTIQVKSGECYVIGDNIGRSATRLTVGGFNLKTGRFSTGRCVLRGLNSNELRFTDLKEAKKVAKLYSSLYGISDDYITIGKSKKDYTLVNIKLIIYGQNIEGWVNKEYLYKYCTRIEKDPSPAVVTKTESKIPVVKKVSSTKVDPKIAELKRMLHPSKAGGVKYDDCKFVVLTKKNKETKKDESMLVLYSLSQNKIVDKFRPITKTKLEKADGNLFIFGRPLDSEDNFNHITQEIFVRSYQFNKSQKMKVQELLGKDVKVEGQEAVFQYLKSLVNSELKRKDFGPGTTNMVLTEKHLGMAFIYGFGLSEELINTKLKGDK